MLLAYFIVQCQPRFSSTSGSCFLDTDRDGKPDYMVFIYCIMKKEIDMLINTCVLTYIFVLYMCILGPCRIWFVIFVPDRVI